MKCPAFSYSASNLSPDNVEFTLNIQQTQPLLSDLTVAIPAQSAIFSRLDTNNWVDRAHWMGGHGVCDSSAVTRAVGFGEGVVVPEAKAEDLDEEASSNVMTEMWNGPSAKCTQRVADLGITRLT